MGLIFSVLVVCVGVYKFIQIYCDTEKKVGYETKEISRTDNVSKNNLASGSTPRVQLCRDFLSHEDVEVECTAQVLSHSRSPSPRRFLVTERNNSNSRTPSPRKFVISEDDASISNLREFLIAKGIPKNNPDTKRFVLIDTKKDFKEVSPLPLPQQFVITQATPAIVHETIANIKQGIGIDLKSLSFNGQEIETLQTVSKNIVDEAFLGALSSITPNSDKPLSFSITKPEDPQSYSVSTKNSSSRSLETLQENQASTSLYAIYNQEPEEFHRDASPYPSLDVPIRRGSISSELLDNPKISVAEIDEEAYSSANKIDVILNSPNFNTTEYWSNKVLVIPPKKSTSGTHSPSFYYDGNDYSVDESTHQHHNVNETKQRSKSATRNNGHSSNTDLRKISSSSKMYDGDFQEPSSLFINVLKKGEDEEFRNSLDGVKRGSEARRSFKKKKNRSQNSLENEENCEEGNKKGQEKTTAPEISRVNDCGNVID